MLTFIIIMLYASVIAPLAISAVRFWNGYDVSHARWRWSMIIATGGLILLTGSLVVAYYYSEVLWFKETGYTKVFWRSLDAKLLAYFYGFIFFFTVISLTAYRARFSAPSRQSMKKLKAVPKKGEDIWHTTLTANTLMLVGALIVSLLLALWPASYWQEFLLYYNQVPTGKTDPLFNRDLSFYLFSLPLYYNLWGMVAIAFVIGHVGRLIMHFFYCWRTELIVRSANLRFDDRENLRVEHLKKIYRSYLSAIIMVSLLLVFLAWLSRFSLLYSTGGAVYGACYTAVHSQLPAINIFMVILLVGTIPLSIAFYRKNWRWTLSIAGVIFVAWLGLTQIWPFFTQHLTVKPTEMDQETPYIKTHIAFTREAYGLGCVKEEFFAANDSLSLGDIRDDSSTIDNIRLWDWHALQQALRQKQEIRQYYKFTGIDVDRYMVNGRYRQVMLSAREMSTDNLPASSKNWVNMYLKYTHGYGACLNLVNSFNSEGWPTMIVENIPPASSAPETQIKRPEIYYGEEACDHVYVNATTAEFDYPQGDTNVYCHYQGKGGVVLGGFFRQLVLSLRFDGFTMLRSKYLTADSRLLFYRNIRERVNEVAPFLYYEDDPYLVIGNGRLYWMIDAYTISDKYPYSQPYGKNLVMNYIRNSVKAVVDAYDGTFKYYVADTNDVIIRTWKNIYPGLMEPLAEMPEFLKAHLRYPEGILAIQGKMLGTYHMTNPNVFFNKEDVWIPALEMHADSLQTMEPYFALIRLPKETKEEFIQMLPFTPNSKQNLISWLASRSDGKHYGELISYKFSKDKQIQGTAQFEAKIDQDPEMSKSLSLWKQKGSEVIRGNTLVIPVKTSLLYVEPIYLKATNTPMPQLTKVAVAYGTRLVWANNFEEALHQLFGISEDIPLTTDKPTITTAGSHAETIPNNRLIKQALEHFNRYQELSGKGQHQAAGKELDALGKALNELK